MNVVQQLSNDLVSAIKATFADTVHLYDADEVLFEKKKFPDYPAIAVLYNSTTARQESGPGKTRTTSADIMFDIYLFADKRKVIRAENSCLYEALDLLDCLRASLLADCNVNSFHRTWAFVSEGPVGVDDTSIAYIQRWRTRVPIVGRVATVQTPCDC